MPIPKMIHYCWLSNDTIPEKYQAFMESWKIKLPDYQFVFWDTKQFDINTTVWTKQAFDVKMYAFAADYIRLYAVYHYGGIYMDIDMEVVKEFDSLLDSELMLAYENHISENLEAGCFGAAKGHPYIKKCMEYFEKTPFFNPAEQKYILNMAVSERCNYIDPLILPEIMHNVMQKYFSHEKYNIYPCEYFTAKNILTGAIKQTKKTYTIHHFATQYHSEEWRKQRDREQKIRRYFGEKTIRAKIFCKVTAAANRVTCDGLSKTVVYYFNKYILKTKTLNRVV